MSDYLRSLLVGPLKYAAPLLAYAILYPLLVKNASLEVLGLWALLGTLASVVNLGDIGFTQLITHNFCLASNDEERRDAFRDYMLVQRSLNVLGILLCIGTVSGFLFCYGIGSAAIYSSWGLGLATASCVVGATLQLKARIDGAVLAAFQNNSWAQITFAKTGLLVFPSAVVGVVTEYYLEGLGIGALLSGVASFVIFQKRVSVMCISIERCKHDATPSIISLKEMMYKGRHFYAMGAGLLLRSPLSRWVLAGVGGLEAVGVFDIAMRITQTLRDLVASGFSVLFPSMSSLLAHGQRVQVDRLIVSSLSLLLPLGALVLGGFIVIAHPFLMLWLTVVPAGLFDTIRILVLWQFITLMNVPYWYLLQAARHERVAAISIWGHTAMLLFAFIPTLNLAVDAARFGLFWTLSSLLAQALIYWFAHWKLNAIVGTVFHSKVLLILIMSNLFLFSSLAIGLSENLWQVFENTNTLICAVAMVSAIFLVVMCVREIHALFVRDVDAASVK